MLAMDDAADTELEGAWTPIERPDDLPDGMAIVPAVDSPYFGAAEAWYDRVAEDGALIRVAVIGDGVALPFLVVVWVVGFLEEAPGIEGWLCGWRYPTLSELWDAADLTCSGAVFATPPYAAGSGRADEMIEARDEGAVVILQQRGILPNSPMHTKAKLGGQINRPILEA